MKLTTDPDVKDIALVAVVTLILLGMLHCVAYGDVLFVPIRVSWDVFDLTTDTFNLYTKHPGQEWILRVEGVPWWEVRRQDTCGKQFSYNHLLDLRWVGRVSIGVASVDEAGNVSAVTEATWVEVAR